ncbi:MAG TPA: sugar phosphate nucleotidyltransferase [Pyrinomonadaceae bacterium]|nr:sugar phosphate nucleotidyltransferase [Pyrinomonadaceae bacterium]
MSIYEPISRAVVLARGLGTRMRADFGDASLSEDQRRAASEGIKVLMPVIGEKTMLELIVENLYQAGFSRLCLVISPEPNSIREFCSSNDLKVEFAVQQDPLGTADAVLAAEQWIHGSELFLVVNSDNLYPVESLRRLRDLNRPGLLGFEREALIANSNIPANRIAKFATLGVDSEAFLTHIVEKPDVVEPDMLGSMNAWLFSPMIFEACRTIEPSIRGEYEIASAVEYAMQQLGERYFVVRSTEGVLDLSSRADVASVRQVLERD